MLEVVYDRCLEIPGFNITSDDFEGNKLRQIIKSHMQLHFNDIPNIDFYTLFNGKKVPQGKLSDGVIHVVPCLPGGKGGFGSMLRAIGAQIEKTTNREACRDLSGRRLRDINEEKRLKKWIAEQAEREREAAERKKKKLSKLCVEPKHEFSDPDYDKARSELIEKVHDAVEEGLKSVKSSSEPSTSSEAKDEEKSRKRKGKEKIKGALWVDELDDLDDDDIESDESEEGTPSKKMKVAERSCNC